MTDSYTADVAAGIILIFLMAYHDCLDGTESGGK